MRSLGRSRWRVGASIALLYLATLALGQNLSPKPAAPLPNTAPPDPNLKAAEALIGRALFLRGFYLANDLHYDATGHVAGLPKSGDWTLAGIDVLTAARRGPKTIELDGLRVAIRYNADNHQFERHPQKDEKIKLLIDDPGTTQAWNTTVDTIFAQGIDPRLQAATPAYWHHYFDPALGWPPDALTTQQVYALNGLPNQAAGVTSPIVAHKADSKMTSFAEHDRVHGTLQLRLVVDTQGIPQRLAIVRPLGYGLDEQAVNAVAKWRFTAAEREGKPVPAAILLNYDFEFMTPPRP